MKVLLYSGAQKAIEKSGVGRALYHQKQALAENGVHCAVPGEAFDLIHINTVFPNSFFRALWAKIQGIPVVYHAHSTKEDFRASWLGSDLLAPLFGAWIQLCYNLGDLILTPTPYSKHLLESYGIQKPIVALSNGIDTCYYQKNESDRTAFRTEFHINPEEKVILSVGLCIGRKGILDFVALAKAMPEYRFIWCGTALPGAVPPEIRGALQTKLPNLTFAGYLDKAALRRAYSGCDLFLFLSHEETEGIVVLEALSMELPVLLRDIPVYADWLEENVQVYKGRTLSEFSEKITCILEGTLPDLTPAGRKVAEARDLHQIGKMLVRTYEDAYLYAHCRQPLLSLPNFRQ